MKVILREQCTDTIRGQLVLFYPASKSREQEITHKLLRAIFEFCHGFLCRLLAYGYDSV
jgi:hypothetical protein